MIAGAGECKVEKASLLFGSTLELLSKINSIFTKSVLQQPTESYWILAMFHFERIYVCFCFSLSNVKNCKLSLSYLAVKITPLDFWRKQKIPHKNQTNMIGLSTLRHCNPLFIVTGQMDLFICWRRTERTSCNRSACSMAFSTFFLDVSWASPPSRNSSRMK